ncbi:MAG: PSD1 and planctomycete cytochrome C domain-containing protein [Planctomycetaceae bacterium]
MSLMQCDFRPLAIAGVIFLLTDLSECQGAEPVFFTKDVRPLLARHCLACHGADEDARQADLRLDLPPAPDANSETAAAIVPRHPDRSELINRITSADPDRRMPPPDSGHSMTPEEIVVVRQWIAEGAHYETHWAFEPPQRPDLPAVSDETWCRNPIDFFVRQQLDAHTLTPSPPAEPAVLLRRLVLDLTGLPPSETQAAEFLKDHSDESYERLVDELLASPGFGEHWARMWLDLARYADTKGYEKDQPRTMWRYRDWVIDAFNQDMPFDQMTREQIAGDLLPDATVNQQLATAYHRNTMTNDEGGTDNEEFRMAAVKDRVDTTVQVWMGLTMGCAKCHSHKYDPISQREYYRFLAYFDQTEDEDRPDDAPKLSTPTTEQSRRLAELNTQIAEVRQRYQVSTPEYATAKQAWISEQARQPAWRPTTPVAATSENGSVLTIRKDGSVLASGERPATDVYSITIDPQSAVKDSPLTAIRLEAMTHPSLPRGGPGRTKNDPNFVLSELTVEEVDHDGNPIRQLPLANSRADFSQNNWEVQKAIDGDPSTGWAISPQQGQPHTAIFQLQKAVAIPPGLRLRLKLSQQYPANSLLLGCVRISVSDRTFESLSADPLGLSEIAAVPESERSDEQNKQLDDAFRRIFPQTATIWNELAELEERVKTLNAEIPQTPVMKDRPPEKARTTYVHVRGNFLEHGDRVQPQLPEAFGQVSEELPANRLAVAEWLLSKDNPLTARVMVNRLWARFFGRGLVETEEDFGQQGSLPTHPALLDWLAIEFRTTDQWSIKRFLKRLVLSSAYRQSSVVTDSSRQLDPENRWLSRSPRFRLSAEVIRDQALAASGLLSRRIGGPSVMPPQPDGIWKATYSSLKWETAENEDRWRRGLYTFLRRTSPYPSMITFDAGSGEVCQIRRIRTNTPLQALVTLNDPVYIEAAGGLARSAASVESMFRRLLVRAPRDEELQRLQQLQQQVAAEFQASPQSAADLLTEARVTEPELADRQALAVRIVLASVLLNLDETVTRP